MRYAIIADIHSNLAAFAAVLNDIERRGGVEEIWCLGDIVGYGPDPHRCIELLRQHKNVSVAGNHDRAAAGQLSTAEFNPDAAAAVRWTAPHLTPEDFEYLKNLPMVIEKGDFTLVHGSPREPIWEYLLSISAARENLVYFKTRYCLVGHSHVPLVIEEMEAGQVFFKQFPPDIELKVGQNRLLINPGGVGQPRDGDPRASYAIYDGEAGTVVHHRVPYVISATQARMREFDLPEYLVTRLEYGY
ncbi:MAG: metallophosphoesterase family protein [Chloroflexi bacterium]|nr:metallophosphoesterase family protein [Chloroflexota bacterium]